MTAPVRDGSLAPYQQRGPLIRFYNALAKTPRMLCKSPAAEPLAKDLAVDAKSADEDGKGQRLIRPNRASSR
ncbi:hypothetical protein GN244_ATG15919 [Phytophthora infestans]|uniref:Uncharacterized protein n=1 Tax=Phytophthora infestans TaxID=4787 RepID=A0A833RSS1_PHYIN|nr:hypothetical protein GN244_ATG15919 [Phytophthora infestans]